MSDRLGDWQTTASGRIVWPLDMRSDEIDILDIGHHLARICRWGGATQEHYSVAEHATLLARWFFLERGDVYHARWALHHDDNEAYLGDVVRPLKRYMPEARRFEDKLDTVIWRKFGLVGALPEAVKKADTAILGDERDQLFGPDSVQARHKREGETGLGIVLPQWPARTAQAEFLATFRLLFPEHAAMVAP